MGLIHVWIVFKHAVGIPLGTWVSYRLVEFMRG